MAKTEADCWRTQAAEAFQKYGSLKHRSDIVQSAYLESDPGSNPLEVADLPNGCSFGSNGQTVLRFVFNDRNELTAILVFRNYIASDYPMDQEGLIEERRY